LRLIFLRDFRDVHVADLQDLHIVADKDVTSLDVAVEDAQAVKALQGQKELGAVVPDRLLVKAQLLQP